MIKRKIKRYGMESYTDSSLASSLNMPRKSSTSLFEPSMKNRPVARFWGDKDGDGVANGFDCRPNDRTKQGPMHRNHIDAMTDKFINWKEEKLKERRDDIDDQSDIFMRKKVRVADISDEESEKFINRKLKFADDVDSQSDAFIMRQRRKGRAL